MTLYGSNPLFPYKPVKSKVFISYQHSNDQYWCNMFRQYFGNAYEIFTDNSLDRSINSDDATYIDRKIREDYITGSSVTIVLCGLNTYKRKYVDWEIYATLEKEHALLGVVLPTQAQNQQNSYFWPDRLFDNLKSGYAHWLYWNQDANAIASAINMAKERAKNTSLIKNGRLKMTRNSS